MRMLDLYCGRWGWSRAFAVRGWMCVGVDLKEPPNVPHNCTFFPGDVMDLDPDFLANYDFICASSPCEEFSVFGLKHFHPNPDYPEIGIALFNHTRRLLEDSGKYWIMENVRPAQDFVGNAVTHCGPFYLWGNAVPPLMPQGIKKSIDWGSSRIVKSMTRMEKRAYRGQFIYNQAWSTSKRRRDDIAKAAEIPLELANCVADYAERLLEP